MNKYVVEIVEINTGEVYRRFEESSQHLADKTERGILHNLNFDKYFTRQMVVEGRPPCRS
jgi:hypothetical protein